MSFLESYVFFGVTAITALTTFCLQDLYKGAHEKIGLIILWITIIISVEPGFNKLHLIWLGPMAFAIPYYALKLTENISKLFGTILALISFSVILVGIAMLP
jgi:hypothetical protein